MNNDNNTNAAVQSTGLAGVAGSALSDTVGHAIWRLERAHGSKILREGDCTFVECKHLQIALAYISALEKQLDTQKLRIARLAAQAFKPNSDYPAEPRISKRAGD